MSYCVRNLDTRCRARVYLYRPCTLPTHLQQLGLHGGSDRGRVDELEGRRGVIGILDREHHQHPDSVVAAVH